MFGSTDSHANDTPARSGAARWAGRGPHSPGGEGEEAEQGGAEVWSRYHCPVCGHSDRVTLTGSTARILCSHCETPLQVTLSTPDSESVSARVDLESRRQ